MPLQLGLGLNRRLGGFNPFTPNHLNPYLLFDTRTSMLGELESPTLDLDPATPSTLDVITATRSGVATYTDADGLIQTAPENTVRVDHVDGVPMMLIEPSATNLVGNSTSFTTGLDLTQETDIDAPDGTNTATRLIGIQAVSGERSVAIASSVTPSTEITGSVYLRGTAGEVISTYTKRHAAGTYAGTSRIDVTLTGDWQRVDGMTFTLNADNNQASIAIVNSTVATADTVDVWGAQLEEGPVSTSYIPTSGSPVTRNADNLVIDGTDFSDFYNATEGTFFVTAQLKDPYAAQVIFMGQTSSQLYLYSNTGLPFYAYDGAGSALYGSVSANELSNFAISYTASTFSISKDGNGPTSPASASGNFGNSTTLKIGNGYFNTLNGHIKRLIYWPTHSDSL